MIMGYVVIVRFADLKDGKHLYEVGDKFPRRGKTATKERIRELSSEDNRMWKAVIKEIADDSNGDMSGTKKLVRQRSK